MDDATREECLGYVGRQRIAEDSMAPERAEKLAVLLNQPLPPEGLPPTWHWAYFSAAIPAGDVGHDGHEKLGLFLPPAPFQRRMWAAGEVEMRQPLALGLRAERVSTIKDVEFKTGSTGDLCFVTIRHEIAQGGRTCLCEDQTVVYRDRGLAVEPLRQPDDPVPEGFRVHPDTMLLFYSAVTHNGHRIHWDREFCRDVEGYPSLVVHGPLMATELCDGLRDGLAPCRFAFRATAPVFDTSPVRMVASGETDGRRDGRIERSDGEVSMKAHWERLKTGGEDD